MLKFRNVKRNIMNIKQDIENFQSQLNFLWDV